MTEQKTEVNSRRKFLQSSAMAGAAGVALPLMGASSSVKAESLSDYFANYTGQGKSWRGPSRVHPDDVRYPSLISGSNLRFISAPDYVSICDSSKEVYKAAKAAFDAGQRITVRSGGHCYEGFVKNDGGAIIDISNLRSVERHGDYYTVEAGASLGAAYEYLFKEYGVTIPAGSGFSVGFGGHICGGGFGVLSRAMGLSVDYLEGIELIEFSGRNGKPRRPKVYLKSQGGKAADIVWAHQGGGGGNFGIVTKYIFKNLPAAPSYAHFQQVPLSWADLDFDQFSRLLSNFSEFFAKESYPGSPFNGLHASISLSPVSGGAGSINVFMHYVGDNPELINDFWNQVFSQPLGGAPSPGYLTFPWWGVTEFFSGGLGSSRAKYKSAYMNAGFPEDQLHTIWQQMTESGYWNPSASLQISSYGGEINRLESSATAVSHRSSSLKLQYQSYWFNPGEDDYHMGWMRNFYEAMYGAKGPVSDGVMDGCYVNYPDVDLANWPELYYKGNYPRLQQVKQMTDPTNQLNHAQSIELPA